MFKTSIIIPTYNRPKELGDCIQSVLKQSVKPDELIVVDNGSLSELPHEKECNDLGIQYIYFKKQEPGLTTSRNKGISLASGDIVFFFDDDVVLSPDYIKEILKIYREDNEGIVGGVSGIVENLRPLKLSDHLRRIFEMFFLITGFNEGKVLPSGFCISFRDTGFPIKKTKNVDFLPGCAMSYRKKVFSKFLFDERKYDVHGGEDKDFSYRVSKKYKLIVNPRAKLSHLESSLMRPDQMFKKRLFIIGTYMFFKDHIRKGRWSWGFFYYSIFGCVLTRLISLAIFPGKRRVAALNGVLSGIRDILRGNIKKVE